MLKENSNASVESRKDFVQIIVNNTARSIHRGRQTVAEIKQVGEVLPADMLEQLIEGRLTPLEDNAAVTIKGNETFISHPRSGTSS